MELIQTCLRTGGHLGASLGAVEIALALHRCLDSPREAILWDVGHQAYAHKWLTGRRQALASLRQKGGISGFLSRSESPHDFFGAGHAGTALSAALAKAWAEGREGAQRWTAVVVGDGALTSGMTFEALNQLRGRTDLGPLLIVLNDNQMSISPNVGAIPRILDTAVEAGAPGFFAALGADYIGPVDGHDVGLLCRRIEEAQAGYAGRPIVLHVLTEKGRGYAPAEDSPGTYHGVAPATSAGSGTTWSDAVIKELVDLAREDSRVVAITAAMSEGTGLGVFEREFPERFFDVGIAEQHAVTFAAGLAAAGYKPFVAIYSTFLQRALDSLIHDVAIQKLPVTFLVDRAGLVGADGITHHGVFDVPFSKMIPGMTIDAPSSPSSLRELVRLETTGPRILRYPRGKVPTASPVFKSEAASTVLVVALGAAVHRVAHAVGQLPGVEVLGVERAFPHPVAVLQSVRRALNDKTRRRVIFVEDGMVEGGWGQSLAVASGLSQDVVFMGLHGFMEHGELSLLEADAGLDGPAIQRAAQGKS